MIGAPRRRRPAILLSLVLAAFATSVHAGVGVWTGVAPRAKSIEAIVRDPLNPSRLWVAAFGSGVYRSTDGGSTWSASRAGLVNTFVRCLAVQPNHPDSIYCGTNDGVFLSVDGGLNWSRLLASNVSVRALAVRPNRTGTVLAGTYGNGIFLSTNGGKNWSAVNLGLGNLQVRDIAFHPSRPETLLAATGTGGGIQRSVTGGLSWAPVPDTTATNGAAEQVQFDRIDPNRVYAAELDRGVIKSADGGLSWVRVNRGLSSFRTRSLAVTDTMRYVGTAANGVFVTSLNDTIWHPAGPGLASPGVDALLGDAAAPLTILAGTDGGGVGRSSNAGATWVGLDGGMLNTYAFSLAVRPSTHAVYVGCGFGDQFWRSGDGAVTWTRATSLSTHGSEHGVAPDPLAKSRVYLTAYGGGVWRSDDDGMTWTMPDLGGTLTNLFVRDVVADPATTGHLFVGSGIGVFESTDAALSWVPRASGLPLSFSTRALALVPGSPVTLFAGSDVDGVWRSTDGGASWSQKSTGIPVPFIYALLADVAAPLTVYAATDAGVYRTLDGGDSWAAVNTGLPPTPAVRALARDELRPGLLFCGISGGGVFESQDGGTTWQAVGGQVGLPNLTLRSLAVDAANATVYAGTDDGVAAFTGYPRPGAAVIEPLEEGRLWLRAWPNPVGREVTTLRFALARPGRIDLAVYDLSGGRVRTLSAGPQSAGVHPLSWDGRDSAGREAPAGVYFVRLSTPQGTASIRLVVLGR